MVQIFKKTSITWKDRLKMKLCGDFLNISKLQMENDELKLENQELNSKIKYSRDNSFSNYWKKTFYEDMRKDIYDYESYSELMQENTKLYSQLQELAKHYEDSKKEIEHLNNRNDLLKYDNGVLESNNKELSKENTDLRLTSHHYKIKYYELEGHPERANMNAFELNASIMDEEFAEDEKDKEIRELKNKIYELKTKFSDIDNHRITRNSKEYNKFKKEVLKRDKSCQCCGTSDDLEVHHGLAFKTYNSLGADTKNGIVLCKSCHKKYHSIHGTNGKTNNPITLAQFLRDYGISMQSKFNPNLSKKDIVKYVNTEIKYLQEEFAGVCPVSVLKINLESRYGINEKEIDNTMLNLQRKGLIYYPQLGYVKVVS